MKYAIGVVIDRDLFPDKLFAPAKRTDLMPDGTNPVLDKELRSEIFSQGTLMLRVVIQVSMLLSIPLMAVLAFPSFRQGGLLRRLRADLQPPGRARFFGRQHHPGARAANLEPAADDPAGAGQDRVRQAAGRAAGFDGADVPAHRAASAGLRLAPRAAQSLLDAGGLLAHHRHHLPGHIDDRPDVLGTGAADRHRDGHDLPDAARSLRVPDGNSVVSCRAFPSVTEEQLAALTVTSPFSAALSVPMHTTRSDAWINQPLSVADQVLVPIARNFRMPVYVVFLCIYPPLGLAFFGVAYLAFRWRWWRAGGLG